MSVRTIQVVINGRTATAAEGASVASILLNEGEVAFRESECGQPRAPLCGMGVCHECRVEIDGINYVRACMTTVRNGMTIVTAGGSQ